MRWLPILAVLAVAGCDSVLGLEERDALIDAPPDASPTFGDLKVVTLTCPGGREPIDLSLDEAETRFVYGCSVASESDVVEAPVVTATTGGTPTTIVTGPANEGSPEVSPDGLAVYYVIVANLIGRIDLKQRPTLDAPWGVATTPAYLNTVGDDRPGPPDSTTTHIVISRAGELVEVVITPFGGSIVDTTVALKSWTEAINPQLSADGLTLAFCARLNGRDLFIARRATVDLPWEPAQPIAELNTGDDESDPWLSADGRRIYFTRGTILFASK